jgi:hypothetical protein
MCQTTIALTIGIKGKLENEGLYFIELLDAIKV